MKTTCSKNSIPDTLASSLAPEEILVGDWIVVLSETCEYPAWNGGCEVFQFEFVRHAHIDSSGLPCKVKDICLPFVLTQTVQGETKVIDVRVSQLARISRRFAKKYRSLIGSKPNNDATRPGSLNDQNK